MSSSHQVRSTTASLLLGIAALVVVLPSAALWGTPSSAMFDLADRAVAPSETGVRPPVDAASLSTGQAASLSTGQAALLSTGQGANASSQFDAGEAPALRTEPWQSPFPLLIVLAVVVGLSFALAVRLPGRWSERIGRPDSVPVRDAWGVRAPPSLL